MACFRSFLALCVVASLSHAADWPQWRGPKRDGVSTETGLLKEWPKEGPKLLWEAKGAGRGYSSMAVAAGKVYTVGDAPSTESGKDEYLTCLEEQTGKVVWQAKLGAPYVNRTDDRSSSRSTPTVDGSLLYVLTGNGDLVCLQTADGKEVWRKNMQKDFGGKKGDGWAYSESVLIDGDNVVCTPGGKTTMTALNKKTGSPVWKAVLPSSPGAGHASIVPTEVGKTRVLVQTTAGSALGVRADDGKVLWSVGDFGATAVVPTPVVRGDLALLIRGYNQGGILVRQVADGDGMKVEEVYGLNKALMNKHGGVVLVGDHVYGDTDSSGSPYCVEFLTGKLMWKKPGPGGTFSLVAADGHLYMHTERGVMALVKASPKEYTVVSSFKLPHAGGRPSWAHPAIANGKLFVREGDYVMCYDVKGK
jgi:outer membrane protein assembly factor BamB